MILVSEFWSKSNGSALKRVRAERDGLRRFCESFIDDATGQLPDAGGQGISPTLAFIRGDDGLDKKSLAFSARIGLIPS